MVVEEGEEDAQWRQPGEAVEGDALPARRGAVFEVGPLLLVFDHE